MLQECLRAGQRVERFHIEAWDGAQWTQVAHATTIGYKRLLRSPAVTAAKVRLVIDESRTNPTLSTFGLFKAPPRVMMEPAGGGFEASVHVRLSSDVGGLTIYYTLDGTMPALQSARYTSPIVLSRATTVKALAAVDGELCIEVSEARFVKCWQVKEISLAKPNSSRYPGHGNTTLSNWRRRCAPAAYDRPVILYTGYGDGLARADLEAAGIGTVLHKPVDPAALEVTLRSALERKAPDG